MLVIWNYSEFVSQSGMEALPMTPAILASAATLAALFQGVGHAMITGFVPAWRWGMPAATDLTVQSVRQLFSESGIRTWDSDLLQSLLLPYAILSPHVNLNNYQSPQRHRNQRPSLDLGSRAKGDASAPL